MTIQQFEHFLMVVKTGSFSKAAECGYVSQPAVSKQITLLEKELGFQLFDRQYRKATLTPPGKMIYDIIMQHTEEFEAICREARQHSSLWSNAIMLGTPHNCGCGNLHELMGDLQREHPELALKVDAASEWELVAQISAEGYDMVLGPKQPENDRTKVNAVTVYEGHYNFVISRNHPKFREDLKPGVFKNEIFYIAAPGDVSYQNSRGKEILDFYGLKNCKLLSMPNMETVLNAVRSGLGVGIVKDIVTIPQQYRLEELPLEQTYELQLAWHEDNKNPFIPLVSDVIVKKLQI